MTVNTPKKSLPKVQGSDNTRDYLKGAIVGGGLWTALETLDNAILDTLADAKGDLIAGTAADTVARLGVGANGTLLVADSAQAAGMAWGSSVAALTITAGPLTVSAGGSVSTRASAAAYAARSGAAGSFAQIDLGRTAQEATLSVVHSAGAFVGGSAVGDLVIRTEGATALALAVNGSTLGLRVTSAGDIQWGKALVALGGGGAPTLGTCGGSGPATTAQNSWMRVVDSTGAAFWVPAWK